MATERQPPDALLASSGLVGGLGDIDDDPDSPDANWMVATGNNVSIEVRTSFPTPTGNPTIGADLQEFKAQVRQYDGGQTGIPTARIELWEDGILIRAGPDVDVVSDISQLISFFWNANEISVADGSLVECKIVGTKTGGAPAKRNTVDVGAVEWNVTYDEPSAYYHGLKVQGEGELALCDVGIHPLRFRKGGTTYGVELVAVDDPNASRIRIKTPTGIKAIRKYT